MVIIGDSCEFTQGCMTILNELKCVGSQLREYFNGNVNCEYDLIRKFLFWGLLVGCKL